MLHDAWRFAAGWIFVIAAVAGLDASPPLQNREFRPEISKTDEGISYYSTGVGYDSRINLPSYSLQLIFSTKTQKYLAQIETEISPGPAGKPVRIKSPGPWLHVDLPPGKYKVKARTEKGQETSRAFSIVGGKVTRLKLVWDISDEDI